MIDTEQTLMRKSGNHFSEVALSVQPKFIGQWFMYEMAIAIRNETRRRLTLSPQTSIRIGDEENHPLRAFLVAETTIESGAEAVLTFDLQRVCGKLPAQAYAPALFLIGHDEQQQPFSETLVASSNNVTVTQAEKPPVLTIGFQFYSTFGVPATSKRGKVWMKLFTGEEYPNDFHIQWQDRPQFFRVFAADGTPIEDQYIFRNIPDAFETALVFEPLADIPVDAYHLIGHLAYFRTILKCNHEGGTGIGAGIAKPVIGAVIVQPSLTLRHVSVASPTVPVGHQFRLEVEVENSKPYTLIIDRPRSDQPFQLPHLYWDGESPDGSQLAKLFAQFPQSNNLPESPLGSKTGLRAVCNGVDVSDKFLVENIGGIMAYGPQGIGKVTMDVRVQPDAPLATCSLFPIIDTFTFAFDEQGEMKSHAVADGQATTPPMSCDITPTT